MNITHIKREPKFSDCITNPYGSFFSNLHNRYCTWHHSRYYTVVHSPDPDLSPHLIVLKQEQNLFKAKSFLVTALKILSFVTLLIPLFMYLSHQIDYSQKRDRYIVLDRNGKLDESLSQSIPPLNLFEGLDLKEVQQKDMTSLLNKPICRWKDAGSWVSFKYRSSFSPHAVELIDKRIEERLALLKKYFDFTKRYQALDRRERDVLTLQDLQIEWKDSAIGIGLLKHESLMNLTLKDVRLLNAHQKSVLEARLAVLSLNANLREKDGTRELKADVIPNHLEQVTLKEIAHLDPQYLNSVLKDLPASVMPLITTSQLPKLQLAELSQCQIAALSRGAQQKFRCLTHLQVKAATPLFESKIFAQFSELQFPHIDYRRMTPHQFLEGFPPRATHQQKLEKDWRRGEDYSPYYYSVDLLSSVPLASYFDKLDQSQFADLTVSQISGCLNKFTPEQIRYIPVEAVPFLHVETTKEDPRFPTGYMYQLKEETLVSLLYSEKHARQLKKEQIEYCLQKGFLTEDNIGHFNSEILSQINLTPSNLKIRFLNRSNIQQVSSYNINVLLEKKEPFLTPELIQLLRTKQIKALRTDLLSAEQIKALFTPTVDPEIFPHYAQTRAREFSDSQLNGMLPHIALEHFKEIDKERLPQLDYSKITSERRAELKKVYTNLN